MCRALSKRRPGHAFDGDLCCTEVEKMQDNAIYQPSRIILALETRLLREMFGRAISRSPFLEVVAHVRNGEELLSIVKREDADWVFVSLQVDGELPIAAESLLADQPSVSIIGLAADGSQVKLGWTEICDREIATAPDGSPIRLRWTESHQKVLTDLSLGQLISVVRKGALWELAIQDVEGISDVERLLSEKRVAVLVADGFEQIALIRPLQALRNTGATVDIISPANGLVKGRRLDQWGDQYWFDAPLDSVEARDYDGLLLPGGAKHSYTLSADDDALGFVQAFHEQGKPIAALGNGVRVLLEANVVQGRRLTACDELREALRNAGAEWALQKVVVDKELVTGQSPADIPEFNRHMIETFARTSYEN
jgi:protease I